MERLYPQKSYANSATPKNLDTAEPKFWLNLNTATNVTHSGEQTYYLMQLLNEEK
jgi:anaerobic selenocysteine-containing dehydrogenase